ncbi:AfsR/SARP family transcriptional regulator [Microlunatus ginsengisoli]|uniref:BTAD domain-containing putative transcriptional regulator n=1 Tax=Microlunatus ginsengisoli TaxID=363863 RepID=A0ABP6ZL11_9ACTN
MGRDRERSLRVTPRARSENDATSRPAVRLLGPLSVEYDGRRVDLGPARQRSVLAVLLLAAGRPVGIGELAERVWGQEPPVAAGQALRSYICRLRQSLSGVAGLSIERSAGGYVLACDPDTVDLARACRLRGLARSRLDSGDAAAALVALGEAMEISREEPLAGLASPWLDDQRRALAHERRCLELEHNDLALRLGEAERILPALIAASAAEPYDERLAGQLVLALHRTGRTSEALTTYDRVRRRLRDELGTEPGPALREVQQLVLQSGSAARPTGRRGDGSGGDRPVPHQLPPGPAGFVDRLDQRVRLDRALLRDTTECRVVALTGTGGVGKTSLAVRWARDHAADFPDGQLFVDLRGFDSGRRPMSTESALHCLVLALGADPAAVPAELDALVGLYRTLLAGRRVLVVADNAADSAHARPLLPPSGPAAAMVTSRSAMTGLAADPGATLLPLAMLAPNGSRALLSERLGADRVATEPAAVASIVAACAGLPLALAVVAGRGALTPHLPLAALAEELSDELTRLSALGGDDPARDLETALASSVAALAPATAEAFALLGLAPGPTLAPDAVAAVCGVPPARAAALLRDLAALHLVEQPYAGRFRMHDLVKLYAAQLGRARPDAGAAVDRLLDFYRGRAGQPGRVGEEYVAAETAALVAATELASGTGRDAAACDLAHCLEDRLGAIGCWRELGRLSELAVAGAARLADPRREIAALVGLGRSRIGLRAFGPAAPVLELALQRAQRLADPGVEAGVHRALARLAAKQGRHDLALPHDVRALELQATAGDRLGQANSYNAIGWHQAHLDAAAEALPNCRRALALFEELDDRSGQAITLDSIGYALGALGRHDEAVWAYRRSAELAEQLGWRVIRAETLSSLAQSYAAAGRGEDARRARADAAGLLRLAGVLAA